LSQLAEREGEDAIEDHSSSQALLQMRMQFKRRGTGGEYLWFVFPAVKNGLEDVRNIFKAIEFIDEDDVAACGEDVKLFFVRCADREEVLRYFKIKVPCFQPSCFCLRLEFSKQKRLSYLARSYEDRYLRFVQLWC
jgi:hypothetical protein